MKKRKSHSFTSKMAIVFTAATLSVSPVSAASYQEAESFAVNTVIDQYVTSYKQQLEKYDPELENNFSCKLTLSDSARAMIGLFTEMNLSWAQTLTMPGTVYLQDNKEYIEAEILFNDTKICSVNVFIDLSSMDTYVKIPEIFESYLYISGETITESTSDTSFYINLQDPLSYLPTASDLETVLKRYSEILISGISNNTSENASLSVGSITQDCQLYEGTATVHELMDTLKEILTTAQTDKELQSILTSVQPLYPTEDLNQNLQQGINDILSELNDDYADEEGEIITRVWTDADNQISGRELLLKDEDASEPMSVFTYAFPKSGEDFEYLLEFNADDILSLTGNGQLSDDILNGTFTLAQNDIEIVSFDFKDFQNSIEENICKGTISIQPLNMIPDDESTSSLLSAFSLDLSLDSSDSSGTMLLSLLTSGTPLADLEFYTEIGTSGEIPSIESFGTTYDVSVETDMNAIMAQLSLDTIINNLTAAGIPEEIIESFF